MKLKNLFAGMILCLAVASCIQDEAQNVEAAIDGCSGNDIQQCLIDPNEFTVQLSCQVLVYNVKAAIRNQCFRNSDTFRSLVVFE